MRIWAFDVFDLRERREQFVDEFVADGIALFGTVEGDGRDGTFDVAGECVVGHSLFRSD